MHQSNLWESRTGTSEPLLTRWHPAKTFSCAREEVCSPIPTYEGRPLRFPLAPRPRATVHHGSHLSCLQPPIPRYHRCDVVAPPLLHVHAHHDGSTRYSCSQTH